MRTLIISFALLALTGCQSFTVNYKSNVHSIGASVTDQTSISPDVRGF